MVRFAVIGTNFITDRLMEAGAQTEGFRLAAVCSRSRETGEAFAGKYGNVPVYTSLEELASSDHVDAVYVASPNCLHASQAIMMMNGGKHVLCEKPAATDSRELDEMLEAAEKNRVVFLEAMRPVFDPGFAKLQELTGQIGKPRSVYFQYCKYSSRYDKFKEGVILNAFNPALSNAAVMDIGVYCIHCMVKLFGEPESVQARSVFLENGMEALGGMIAGYGDMQVSLQYSKITDAFLPSQIQGEEGTLVIRNIPDVREIEVHRRNMEPEVFKIDKAANNMVYELQEFIRLVESGESGEVHNRFTRMEMKVLDEVRRAAGIRFR